VKQKINIFEELNKMKSLITTKPGIVISEQQSLGTPLMKIPTQSEKTQLAYDLAALRNTQQNTQQKTPSGYDLSGTKNTQQKTQTNTNNNYARMVGDGSKKIQTSLGMSPTGQLTDNDLQKVLSTLNGETPQAGNQTPQGLPTTTGGQLDLQKILVSL
jgi:hypothetical protein